jgi:hypothetical protein
VAKISANGHREIARWSKGSGAELILTAGNGKYRILSKCGPGAGWLEQAKISAGKTITEAEAIADGYAARLGYERVNGR